MTNRCPTTQEVYGISRSSSEQDDLERKFFNRVVLANGTYKTTNADRLNDLNKLVLPFIKQRPWTTVADNTKEPIKIMDVGVSSGISTVEWYQHLKGEGVDCRITATDIVVHASLLVLTSNLAALIDRGRNILHMDVFQRGIPPKTHGLKDVPGWMLRTLFKTAMRIDADLSPLNGDVQESAKGKLLTCTPVTLLTRKFIQGRDLRVIEDDLLAENRPDFKNSFHVVRASNILNRAYFSDQTLMLMVERLRERLMVDGLLIICRTTDTGMNNGTIFKLTRNRTLSPVTRLNDGSEIENLMIQN